MELGTSRYQACICWLYILYFIHNIEQVGNTQLASTQVVTPFHDSYRPIYAYGGTGSYLPSLPTYLAAWGCLLPNFGKIIQEKRQEEDKERRTWNSPGKLFSYIVLSVVIDSQLSYPVGWLAIASYSYLSAQTLAHRAQISLVRCASYTVVDSQLPVYLILC